jgi:hypothetical protein
MGPYEGSTAGDQNRQVLPVHGRRPLVGIRYGRKLGLRFAEFR